MRKLMAKFKKGNLRSAPLDLILAANGKPTGDQLREQLLRDERERRKEEILGCAATCSGPAFGEAPLECVVSSL